jgi:tetratricopeptide (TPR) repeat protein
LSSQHTGAPAAAAAREAHAPDIAHHFAQSGDLQKGLAYSLEAARQARRLYAHDEALRHYQHAAESAQAMNLPDQLAAIYENMAEVHYQRGVYPAAADCFQQALTLTAPDDGARRAVLHRKIGDAYAQVGDERGLNFLRLAERELDPASQTDDLALTLTWLGRYHHYHAQHRTAIEFYERARQLAEPQDRVNTLFRIYICFSGAYQHLTQYQESGQLARRVIELGERKHYLQAKAVGYQFLAENAHTQGYWEKALECAAINREIAERIGALDDFVWPEMVRAQALYGRGGLQLAHATAQAALSLAEQIGEGRVAVLIGSLLTQIETDLGHDDAARANGELWIKRSDELGQVFMQCVGRHGLAYLHAQHEDWEPAAALYEQCAALYTPTDSRVAPLWLGPYPALAHLGLGRVAEAAQLVTDFLTLAREAEAPHPIGCALRVQGQIYSAQGLMAKAAAAFEESIATLDELGSRLELGRACFQRGVFRRSTGDAEAGRDDLQRALELFEACGAARDRARADSSLASGGIQA